MSGEEYFTTSIAHRRSILTLQLKTETSVRNQYIGKKQLLEYANESLINSIVDEYNLVQDKHTVGYWLNGLSKAKTKKLMVFLNSLIIAKKIAP